MKNAVVSNFLNAIKTPVLILNALNDSFLSEACFPFEAAKMNPNIFLETPKHGGHVGFINVEAIIIMKLVH